MKTCKDCPAFKRAHVFQSTCSCGITKTKIADACIMSGYEPKDTRIHESGEGWDMCIKGYLLLACHRQRDRAMAAEEQISDAALETHFKDED